MKDGKTSTFTIHHDRCDPSKWTPGDVLLLAKFLETGNLGYAASLSRLGVQLVTSEHHVPKGGTLEPFGFAKGEARSSVDVYDTLEDACDGDDVTAIARVYRGPAEYAVAIPTGDEDGNFEGYEYEIKPTEEEATAYAASLREEAAP